MKKLLLKLWLPAGVTSWLALAGLTGCVHVKTEPIRVEPIEITMNVNLRVARELDDFFADLDAESEVMEEAAPASP